MTMTLSNRNTAIQLSQASAVPHLCLKDVKELADAAGAAARNVIAQERDPLLIQTLFDGALRVSEGLRLTPASLHHNGTGWSARLLGKGNKYREAALSASIVARLHQYCYRWGIEPRDRVFTITKYRAHQILQRAFERAGIQKPPHVGAVHVLRHSGALERLKETGNPHALQEQLGHTTAKMTLRYLKTLTAEEALRVNQAVDFRW
jgi:integrase